MEKAGRLSRTDAARVRLAPVAAGALAAFLLLSSPTRAQGSISTDFRAYDTPNDNGSSITLEWQGDGLAPGAAFRLYRQAEGDTAFAEIGRVPAASGRYVDGRGLVRGGRFRYVLRPDGASAGEEAGPTGWVVPRAQWFDRSTAPVAVAVAALTVLLLLSIRRARRGTGIFIRRIAGLDAVDEAIGRATEMGRPILFSPGIDEADQPGTIAGLAILGKVMERAAASGTRTIVPNRDPVVMTVAREVGRQACLVAGRPEFYREEDIYYATYSQFGYAATTAATMVRDRPAVNFFMGGFAGEALILAETGRATGAMQIAGCDAEAQLPFFITTCDYTLIGEELYAASAYLSREPMLTGSLKAQDAAKAILVALIGVGMVLAVLGIDVGAWLK